MDLRILCFAILFLGVVYPGAAVEPSKNQSQCQRQCGDQSVPYPFGLDDSTDGCFLSPEYMLTCNHSFTPPILFLGNIPILNMSVENATAIAYLRTAYRCYDESGVKNGVDYSYDITGTPFTFSSTHNTFTAIGCDTQANLYLEDMQLGANCSTICDNSTIIQDLTQITQEVKPCSEFGCCQTQIPKGLKYLEIYLTSFSNHSNLLVSNPCDYAFLTAGPNPNLMIVPEGTDTIRSQIVLDWAVGDTTCEDERKSIICGPNTNCINSDYSSGYRCSCMQGYAGNPFTVQGCQEHGDTKAAVSSATADIVQGSYVGYMVLLLVSFVKVWYW